MDRLPVPFASTLLVVVATAVLQGLQVPSGENGVTLGATAPSWGALEGLRTGSGGSAAGILRGMQTNAQKGLGLLGLDFLIAGRSA